MKLVVGLGNIGKEYELTRHNIGWIVLEQIFKRVEVIKVENSFRSEVTHVKFGNEKFLILKPQTYMNLSGEAVRDVMKYYKLTLEDLIVIYDDKDIEFAKPRFKVGGSSAGHNGIKNIILNLNTQNFYRLRVGIGAPLPNWTIANWVLSKINEEELAKLNESASHFVDGVFDFIKGQDFIKIMNKYN